MMETEMKAPTRKITVRCQFCDTWNRIDAGKVTDGPKCGKCAKPILLERPVPLNDDTFLRTINESDVPVAVDFYADWCGPCRMMAPALDEFAQKRAGDVLVLKLDTDANPLTASRFGIRGIPTLIAFQGGSERSRHVGVADMKVLENLSGVS
jgi:thioredoxin 2